MRLDWKRNPIMSHVRDNQCRNKVLLSPLVMLLLFICLIRLGGDQISRGDGQRSLCRMQFVGNSLPNEIYFQLASQTRILELRTRSSGHLFHTYFNFLRTFALNDITIYSYFQGRKQEPIIKDHHLKFLENL